MKHKDSLLTQSLKLDTKNTPLSTTLPIYQNATFNYLNQNDNPEYYYARKGNPNRTELEDKLKLLDNASQSLATNHGTSDIFAVLSLIPSNSHIMISQGIYSGTKNIINQLAKQHQIEISILFSNKIEILESQIKSNTRLVFIESPSNPTQQVFDIRKIAEIIKNREILFAVDNSLLSSYFHQPLEFGADIAVQSAAKHLGGHNDLMAGIISSKQPDLDFELKNIVNSFGLGLSAFDSWLLSRSLSTLAIRLKQQQENALSIANWLSQQKEIHEIYYLGLDSHSNYKLHLSQSKGFGSIISFCLANDQLTSTFIEKAQKEFSFSRNFGSIQTSISLPSQMSHKEDFLINNQLPFNKNLIRLSVGIENIKDIYQIFNCIFHNLQSTNFSKTL
jgi:cystathionine beta-lyase/cystathionine gamma-synthase